MKKLFTYADAYIQECTWKDLALLKFCLAAIGLLIGLEVPEVKKKPSAIAGSLVFLATYIPLMAKFFRVVLNCNQKEIAE